MTARENTSPDGRVYFRDVKPYEVPESLDALRGPAGGVVELSHSVLWAPGGGRADLDVNRPSGPLPSRTLAVALVISMLTPIMALT